MEQQLTDRESSVVTVLPEETAGYDYERIIAIADRSDKMVDALNRIMRNAIRVTTWMDWVLIGGKPYLQESGATKVARAFGVCWKIVATERELDEGYPSFTYRMEFRMGNNSIECEGSRSGKDDFFAGKNRSKGPDEIDANDVKKAAFTNCINNGIKRLLPGLRNIDIASLQAGGIDVSRIQGYTFKEGSRGGTTKAAEASGLTCADCGTAITQKVASYSEGKYGRRLCMNCQKKAASGPQQSDVYDDAPLPDAPPEEY